MRARCSRCAAVSAAGSSGTKLVDQIWQCGCGIAGAHHCAAVLEDLHVLDPVERRQISGTRAVQASTTGRISARRHARQGEAVVGMKAEHLADAASGLGGEQRRGGAVSEWQARSGSSAA